MAYHPAQSFCQKEKENKERKTNERVVSILFAATNGEGLKWIGEIWVEVSERIQNASPFIHLFGKFRFGVKMVTLDQEQYLISSCGRFKHNYDLTFIKLVIVCIMTKKKQVSFVESNLVWYVALLNGTGSIDKKIENKIK